MQVLHVRVDEKLAEQLQQLAADEDVSISQIIRRAVRKHVQAPSSSGAGLARAHEGSGRVR